MRLIVKDWIKFAVSRSRLRCTENGGQLPDPRPERENCFLTLPVVTRCDESHPPGGGYLRFYSFGWLWPGQNPIVGVVRRFVLFGETTNAPRLDWKITVLLHLPRPTLALDLQLPARSSYLRVLRATLEFPRVITILQCRFLLFDKINGYLGFSLWKRWRILEWYNKTLRAINVYTQRNILFEKNLYWIILSIAVASTFLKKGINIQKR